MKMTDGILEMALVGFQQKHAEVVESIRNIQRQLGTRSTGAPRTQTDDGAKPRRTMSAAARKRIAVAQKKRWAEYNKKKAEGSKPAAKKATAKNAAPRKKMSAARKAALVANLKKARAARAAKQSAGEAVPF
jgi:hypothetical protein